MEGEKDLTIMLQQLNPRLEEAEYVFCSVSIDQAEQLADQASGWFNEEEGVTLILEKSRADSQKMEYGPVFKKITLRVHSSLISVGLLALVTNSLAQGGLSVNVISGYYQDHLFLEKNAANQALSILEELSESGRIRH